MTTGTTILSNKLKKKKNQKPKKPSKNRLKKNWKCEWKIQGKLENKSPFAGQQYIEYLHVSYSLLRQFPLHFCCVEN